MLRYRQRETVRTPFPCPNDMPAALHSLLIQRGIASAEEAQCFLHPSPDHLHDPALLNCMSEAVARIRAAIEGGEHICVYGDYDVDGVSASALLSSYLKKAGASVEVYLPSRHTEGYGLNEEAIRQIAQRAKLIVTVDCGVTSVELIDLAKSLGMDAVVTDHHRPAEQLPDCPVVNPLLNDYPFPALCGAGVAFKLVQALGGLESALEYIDIAALATVADVVSLTGENRVIVRLGLDRINSAPRAGLDALIEVSGLSGKRVSAGSIAFQLAPRLNAGGRIGSARRSFDLLTADSAAAAIALAEELEAENRERKQIEQQILADAEQQLDGFDFPGHRILVLADCETPGGGEWNAGVIGLAASRLVEKYHYPVILLSGHDGVLTGSCRSIPGVDIHAALTAAKDHLVRYGGHKQAAGLTLLPENLPLFRKTIEDYLKKNIPPACYIPDQEYDTEISFGDLTEGFVSLLEALQPTGFGNPAPVFRAGAQLIDARGVGMDGAHLRVTLSEGGVRKNGICFREGARAGTLPEDLDVLFTPKLNTFMGRTEVQLELKSIVPGDVLSAISAKKREEPALLRNFLTEILYNKKINISARSRQTITAEALAAQAAADPQGTLILTASLDDARRLWEILRGSTPDVCFGTVPDDPRAFNAICAYPPADVPGCYRRIVLAGMPEGFPVPDGAELLYLDAPAPEWTARLPDVNEMRAVYKAAMLISRRKGSADLGTFGDLGELAHRMAADAQLSDCAASASLLALADMDLITLTINCESTHIKLNEMRKTDPGTSAVWQLICRWKAGATG